MIPSIVPEKASIETTTACNHSCSYCPISMFPQKQHVMPLDFFDQIMSELKGLGTSMKRISFTHYNEPLLDPYFVERVGIATGYTFFNKIIIFSNLSVMAPSLPDDLQSAKERLIFSINLPTTDEKRYEEIHGIKHYRKVEQNIRRLIEAGFEIKINVQSNAFTNSEDETSVVTQFQNIIPVDSIKSDNRAGLIDEIKPPPAQEGILIGCLVKRPTNYVHIGVDGEVFLCNQDFFKKYKFGSLRDQHLSEILSSDQAKEYLGFLHGEKEPPDDFICKSCEFAIFKKKER